MKRWIVSYRQFARGRRSLKSVVIDAGSQVEAIRIFNTAVRFAQMDEPIRFSHVKLISVFEEV